MADRYWRGGTGTWDTTSTTNWSATSNGAGGASVPTTADSVFFDQAGTYTVTMTGALTCLNITVSAGTVTFATGTTPGLTIAGSISLVAGTVWNSTATLTLSSSTTGRTVTTNGVTLSSTAVNFANATGGWSLGSALIVNGSVGLSAGSINLNGFDLTTYQFNSSGSGVRSVAFGSNDIILTSPTAGTVNLSAATATNFSWTGTGGFRAAASVTRTFTFGSTAGGTATNGPNITLTGSGTAVQTFTSGSWFNSINFGTTAFTVATTTLNLNSVTLSTGGTFTNLNVNMVGTGTITPNGKTILTIAINNGAGISTLAGALTCTSYTQTAGTIDFANFNLTCSSTATYTAGTLNNIGTINCATWTCGGTFTLSQGTITPSVSFVVTGGFNYTTGSLAAVPTFTHTSGSVNFSKAYALTATGTYTFTAGTLTLSGVNLTTGIFSSSNTNTRLIDFGTNNIILAHTTAATTVLAGNANNFTWAGTTGGFVTDASVTRTISWAVSGGTQANATNFRVTNGASTISMGSSYFKLVDFTGTTCTVSGTVYADTIVLASGGTYTSLEIIVTRTQTWTPQFGKQLGGIGVDGIGATLTLENTQTYFGSSRLSLGKGILDLGGFDHTFVVFTYSNFAGNGGQIAFGSNWITVTGTAFSINMVDISQFSWTGTGGFRISAVSSTLNVTIGTTTPPSNPANAPNLSFIGTGTVSPVLTGSYFNRLDFGTTAFTIPSTTVNINSDITLSTGGTFTSLAVNMVGTGSTIGTINTNGKSITSLMVGNGTSTGTVRLNSAVTTPGTTGQVILQSGTLDLNGFTVTTSAFNSNYSNTRSISFGSSNIVLSHPTAASTVLSMATPTGFSCSGTGGFVTDASITRTLTCLTNSTAVAGLPNLTFTGSGSAVITFTTGNSFNNIDWGTVAITLPATVINVNNLTSLSAGSTYTNVTFAMVSGSTINTSGKTIAALTINNSGTTTLGAAITASGALTLTSGTLNLGGFNLTAGTFVGTGALTRSISFGSNNIVLNTATAAATVISLADATNFSWTGTGGFVTDAAVTRTFTCGTTGGTSTNALNLTLTGSGTAVQTFTTGGWWNRLDFGSVSFTIPTTTLNLNTFVANAGVTYTGLTVNIVKTVTVDFGGKSIAAFTVNVPGGTVTLGSLVPFAAATATTTLTAGTLDLGGFDLTTGVFASTNTNTRAIAFGSNNILLSTTTAAATNLSMANATGFSWTGTGGFRADASITRTFTFGTTGGSSINAPNFTFTGSGSQVGTITSGSWFNKLDFGTTGFAVPATTLNLNSITLSSGAGGSTSNLTAVMVGTGTITNTNLKNLAALTINCPGGSTTLVGPVTIGNTATCLLTAGNLNLNGNTLTVGVFSSSNTNTRSITFAGGIIDLVHITADTVVLDIAIANGFTCDRDTSSGFTTSTVTTRTVRFGTTSGGSSSNAPDIKFYFVVGNSIVTIATGSWFNKLDFGDTGYTVPIATVNINSLVLSTGNYTGLSANMVGTGTIASPPGEALNALTIANGSGTTSFASGTTTISATIVNFTSGNFDFGGSNTISSIGAFNYIGTNILNFGTGSTISAGTFNLNTTGTFTLSQGTINVSTGFTLTAGTFVYSGGSITGTGTALTQTAGTFTLQAALDLPATLTYALTAGTLNLDGFNLTVGAFSSSNSNLRTINWGTSSIILDHSVAATTVLAMANIANYSYTGTQNFVSDAAITRTLTYGTTGGSIGNSPNLSFTGTGTAVLTLTTGSWFNTLNFGTTGHTSAATNLNLNSLVLGTGTYTSLTATMLGTGTITPNGKSVGPLVINNGSGTTTLLGALGCTTATYTSGTIDFASFNLTGSGAITYNAGTLQNIGTISCTTWNSAGTFTLSQGIISCTTFSLTGTFNYSGGTLTANAFTHTSGVANLEASLTLPLSSTYTLTLGSLNLNNYDLSCGIFSSNNANARSVAFGSGSVVLTHPTTSTVLNLSTLTGFSWTGTGGFQSTAAVTRTYTCGDTAGGSIITAPNLTLTGSGTATQTFTTAGWFNKLDLGTTGHTSAATSLNLESLILGVGSYGNITANMVGSGTLVNNGALVGPLLIVNNGSNTVTLGSNFLCSTYTQTQGTLDFAGYNLTASTSITYASGNLLNIGVISSPAWTVSGNLIQNQGTFTATTSFLLNAGSYTHSGGTFTPTPLFTQTQNSTFTVNKAITTTTTAGTHDFDGGNLILNGVDLTCGLWTCSGGTNGRFLSFGANNIIVTGTTGAVINMVAIANYESSGTGGFRVSADGNAKTISVGSTNVPSLVSNLPNLTITGTGSATGMVITSTSQFNKLDYGVCAFTQPAATLNAIDLVLSPNGNFTSLTFNCLSTESTINTNGKPINTLNILAGARTTLLNNLDCNSFVHTKGTLNLNGYSLTTPAFSSASVGGTYRGIFGPGSVNCTGSGATAFAVTEGAGFFGSNYLINMTSATAKTFAGGDNGKFGTLNQAGAGVLTITGSNSFDNIIASQRPGTISVAALTTQRVNELTLSGSAEGIVTLNSVTANTRFNLLKTSGGVNTSYLSIKDCYATGGATWRTDSTTGVDAGNNFGWTFAAVPPIAGQFMAFF